MKKLNTRAILKCLRSYVGLSQGTYATKNSSMKNFQGCAIGCLARCAGEDNIEVIKNETYKVYESERWKDYNIPHPNFVEDANDSFKGSNAKRLEFMCLWFKGLARAMRHGKFIKASYNYGNSDEYAFLLARTKATFKRQKATN